MQRRQFLSVASAGMGIATAGCLGTRDTPRESSTEATETRTNPGTSQPDTPTARNKNPDGTETPKEVTVEPRQWSESRPGRPTDSAPYPTYGAVLPVDESTTVSVLGTDSLDPKSTPLYLDVTVHARRLPEARYTFALTNRGDRSFMLNPYSWLLHRWEQGEWWYIAPLGAKAPLLEVRPDDSRAWHVTVTNEGITRPVLRTGGERNITVRGLGGGTYAFGIDGWWESDASLRRVVATRFRLQADQVRLRPSTAVTSARREDDTLVVTADRDADTSTYPAVFELQRAPDASGAVGTITETVLRKWPLRDALAFALPEVDRVRVEAPTDQEPPFGVGDDWPPLTYEGETFRVTTSPRSDSASPS